MGACTWGCLLLEASMGRAWSMHLQTTWYSKFAGSKDQMDEMEKRNLTTLSSF